MATAPVLGPNVPFRFLRIVSSKEFQASLQVGEQSYHLTDVEPVVVLSTPVVRSGFLGLLRIEGQTIELMAGLTNSPTLVYHLAVFERQPELYDVETQKCVHCHQLHNVPP